MIAVAQEKDFYLSSFADFEQERRGRDTVWLARLREEAMAQFRVRGFPTTKDEQWRFTNVAPIAKTPFHRATATEPSLVEAASRLSSSDSLRHRIVFVNGRWAPELTSLSLEDVTVASLAGVLASQPSRVESHLARHASIGRNPFVALNTAFLEDGAYVEVPRGAVVREPLHLLFLSAGDGQPAVAHPRNLIVAGPGSQVTIVETYAGFGTESYFTNGVTEIVAEEDAIVDHYKLQRESETAFHVATLAVYQGRNSNFASHAISLGGSLVRNDINVLLDAEGCECVLNGLFLAGGRQHVDNHTHIEHARPHCTSRELYKGILDGSSRGVFHGVIVVQPDAQKTDAQQTNKNLLLSRDALINSIPQLQIYANDVKCKHGSTTGQLDDDAIFYLCSRGIGYAAARSLLTYAFASDLLGRIKVESIRAGLDRTLHARLPEAPELQELAP